MSEPVRGADRDLEGLRALVCGAGAQGAGIGNGRASALLMARAGARVLCIDRDGERAETTARMIREEGGDARGLCVDVSAPDGCDALARQVTELWGGLDILVNNVGIGSRGNVVEETPEGWERVMRINVTSMYLTCHHLVPLLAAAGGGAIVNVSSISALRPRGLTAYSASKGAVIAFTRALAVDHGPQGIRANCVAPGPVYTPMVYGRGMSPQAREARRRASVLGIEGTPWDVGHAVRFLASGQARYITGQTLVVDGGVTLVGPERGT